MALDKFRAAPLPNPPAQWDPQYMRQVIRVLETYFSQLDSRAFNNAEQYSADRFIGGSFTGTVITSDGVYTDLLSAESAYIGYQASDGVYTEALISNGHLNGNQISDKIMATDVYAGHFYGNGEYINLPYNQFQSNTDQTAANTYTAYAITYDVSDYPDGISLSSGSHINVAHDGIYLFTFSIQFQNDTNATETVDVWFRKNGTDVANSNSQFSLPARKSAGTPASLIAVTPFMIDLNPGDYIEIMWRPSVTTLSIQQLPAVTASPGVTPAIPATPAVLLTAQFVSAQFPPVTRVAPLPVFGFGQVGDISVVTR